MQKVFRSTPSLQTLHMTSYPFPCLLTHVGVCVEGGGGGTKENVGHGSQSRQFCRPNRFPPDRICYIYYLHFLFPHFCDDFALAWWHNNSDTTVKEWEIKKLLTFNPLAPSRLCTLKTTFSISIFLSPWPKIFFALGSSYPGLPPVKLAASCQST